MKRAEMPSAGSSPGRVSVRGHQTPPAHGSAREPAGPSVCSRNPAPAPGALGRVSGSHRDLPGPRVALTEVSVYNSSLALRRDSPRHRDQPEPSELSTSEGGPARSKGPTSTLQRQCHSYTSSPVTQQRHAGILAPVSDPGRGEPLQGNTATGMHVSPPGTRSGLLCPR